MYCGVTSVMLQADHADSNQLMARSAWLDKVDIPAENIHAMPTDASDPC